MKTARLSLTILVAALTAACAAPRAHVTPTQRATALQLFVNGASTDEIATKLAIAPDDARACVRTSLMTLMRRYRQDQ